MSGAVKPGDVVYAYDEGWRLCVVGSVGHKHVRLTECYGRQPEITIPLGQVGTAIRLLETVRRKKLARDIRHWRNTLSRGGHRTNKARITRVCALLEDGARS